MSKRPSKVTHFVDPSPAGAVPAYYRGPSPYTSCNRLVTPSMQHCSDPANTTCKACIRTLAGQVEHRLTPPPAMPTKAGLTSISGIAMKVVKWAEASTSGRPHGTSVPPAPLLAVLKDPKAR